MDQVSIAKSAQMIDNLNKTMAISNIKMAQMAEKMMNAATGANVGVSREMGKGEQVDLLA